MLSTGTIAETSATDGEGDGIAGPNNGNWSTFSNGFPFSTPGELSSNISTAGPDLDYVAALPDVAATKEDGVALEFQVTTTVPGFFVATVVYATDEYKQHALDLYNDSPVILVKSHGEESFQNIFQFRSPDGNGGSSLVPLRLLDLKDCLGKTFLGNDTAPFPFELALSAHNPAVGEYYDHEFGGFTRPLTRQTGDRGAQNPEPSPAGVHTIKYVLQDVGDSEIDSAMFIGALSFRFIPLVAGDLDLDGDVDSTDLGLLLNNFNSTEDIDYTQGNIDGDGDIDSTDLGLLLNNFNSTGGYVYKRADFNGDGTVDAADEAIWILYEGLTKCATRFEGDADGDGDVDDDDHAIWSQSSN